LSKAPPTLFGLAFVRGRCLLGLGVPWRAGPVGGPGSPGLASRPCAGGTSPPPPARSAFAARARWLTAPRPCRAIAAAA